MWLRVGRGVLASSLLAGALVGCATGAGGTAGRPGGGSRQADAIAVSVFFSGHQDDWQLFMGDQAAAAAAAGQRLVFVYATAGDLATPGGWEAREKGALASTELLEERGSWECARRAVRGHGLWCCTRGRTASYFLRIPELPELGRLRDGRATTTADGAVTYVSFEDLTATVAGLLALETGSVEPGAVRLHAVEPDEAVNPGDHPDHKVLAEAVRAAVHGRGFRFRWYVSYDSRNRPVNLDARAYMVKAGLFMAYDRGVQLAAGPVTYCEHEGRSAPIYAEWLWRTWWRDEP